MQKVILYTTPTCPFCKKVKAFMEQHHVVYTNHNVLDDQQARTQMIAKSGQMGVPVIRIDDTLIVGFDEAQLRKALHIQKP